MRIFHLFSLAVITSMIVACGGGGGGSVSNTPVNSAPATSLASSSSSSNASSLVFEHPGSVKLLIGDTFTNKVTSTVAGAVTYTVNDPTIATVTNDGVLTVKNAGSATITAKVTGDTTFSGSFTVIAVPATFSVTAWMDSTNTLVTPPASTTGIEVYQSSSKDCDWLNIVSCPDGTLNIFNGNAITNPANNLTKPGFYAFKHGTKQGLAQIKSQNFFTDRAYHQAVSFNNQLFIIGGENNATTSLNDVWSSSDNGATWTQLTANAGFPGRSDHQVIVFNNRLWVIGGYAYKLDDSDNSVYYNDIWSSADGVHWQLEKDHAAFSPRASHKIVSFKGKLWLISGLTAYRSMYPHYNLSTEVWSSTDAINWTKETDDGNFSQFEITSPSNVGAYDAFVFHDKLWIVGNFYSDVWSSDDGIHWNLETKNASTSFSSYFKAIVFNDKLWIVSDQTNVSGAEIWSSPDGKLWEKSSSNPPFYSLTHEAVIVHDNQIWILGGYRIQSGYNNRVWSSADGAQWVQHAQSQGRFAQIVNFKNNFWFLDGLDEYNADDIYSSNDLFTREKKSSIQHLTNTLFKTVAFRDQLWILSNLFIYSSSDGNTWEQRASNLSDSSYNNSFPRKTDFDVVLFKDKLWIFGGYGRNVNPIYPDQTIPGAMNDIWSSTDGVNWSKAVEHAAFSPRNGQQVISYNNKLWMINGVITDTTTSEIRVSNEVWSSDNGTDWVLKTNHLPFSSRTGFQTFVHNNKMWIVGGLDYIYKGAPQNDIWSSTDGINWKKELDHAEFSPRSNHKIIDTGDTLYLFGGVDSQLENLTDVWSSSDGIKWRKGISAKIELK